MSRASYLYAKYDRRAARRWLRGARRGYRIGRQNR